MAVEVLPEQFALVLFDAPTIERAMGALLGRLGWEGRAVRVEVDETSPIARVRVQSGDPLVLLVDSGAFEDTRRPRELSELAVATAAGRMLLRVRDRESGAFDVAPADDDLTLAEAAAWDVHSIGRLGRLGYEVNRQRWLYNFRNRHGFTDTADGIFDALWLAEGLTWAELSERSGRALAARQPV